MKTKQISLPFKFKKTILALGSQTKNTVCFAQGNTAYISRVHPDISTLEDFLNFEKDVKFFLQKSPRIIAHDLHPEYQSSKYALSLPEDYSLQSIQHHHAHIASCMAENNLTNQKVIGVAFDGTGLGIDDTIWGAEFLSCDYKTFRRLAHLKEIPLVGGERAILEPWRLLSAWLNFDKSIAKNKILQKIYQSGINSPLASSMGRLFDAAGSLILGKKNASFEAELAIELEKLAARSNFQGASYNFKLTKSKNSYILDPTEMFKQVIRDLKCREPRTKIAWRIHRSVAEMVIKTCLSLRREHKINKVVLSGGVFQNKILLMLSLDLLYKQGFQVFTHKYLSCNDSGISLGQAVIAGSRG